MDDTRIDAGSLYAQSRGHELASPATGIQPGLDQLLEATSSRDRAQRDNRTKDEFLAILAHELRTPLGAISAAVRGLDVAYPGGTPAARAHDVISRQVAHISRLVEDLLDVERVVSGKIRLARAAGRFG